MSILDYHAKNLCPAVWDQDGTRLTGRFLATLQDSVRDLSITRTLLAGDSVSHYWTDDSPIDIIILTSQGKLDSKPKALKIDQHDFIFHVLPNTNLPRNLAELFGPIYSIETFEWFGVVSHDTGELLRPSGLVRRLAWLLFKVLDSGDLDAYTWRIELAAFDDMKTNTRNDTLEEINRRIILANHAVDAFLPTLQRKDWAAAADFEATLEENDYLTQDKPKAKIDKKAQVLILNARRWRNLYELFLERHERLSKMEQANMRTAMRTAKRDMVAGEWYKTKLELFPLLYVRNVRRDMSKVDAAHMEDVPRLVEFDLVGEDGIPVSMIGPKEEIEKYGLAEAKEKDFEDLGLQKPLDFCWPQKQ